MLTEAFAHPRYYDEKYGDSTKKHTVETDYGPLHKWTHVKGYAERFRSPDVEDHFGQIIKTASYDDAHDPKNPYRSEIRRKSDSSGHATVIRQGLHATAKEAQEHVGYMLAQKSDKGVEYYWKKHEAEGGSPSEKAMNKRWDNIHAKRAAKWAAKYKKVGVKESTMTSNIDESVSNTSLGVLSAKHFEHHLNATRGGNFDLSDSQMASHAKKAHAVKTKIEHQFGSHVAHAVAHHSEMAADHEEGTTGDGGNFHHDFAKKYLGGIEHKKYKSQIDKQDLKMHGDTGVTTHHIEESSMTDKKQITELSKKTLGSYVEKASRSYAKTDSLASDRYREAKRLFNKPNVRKGHESGVSDNARAIHLSKLAKKDQNKATNRFVGIRKAVSKLTKEDVEQIDEAIKSSKLDRAIRKYVPGAGKRAAKERVGVYRWNAKLMSTSRPGYPHHDENMKELGSSKRAADRYKKIANEDVELLDEKKILFHPGETATVHSVDKYAYLGRDRHPPTDGSVHGHKVRITSYGKTDKSHGIEGGEGDGLTRVQVVNGTMKSGPHKGKSFEFIHHELKKHVSEEAQLKEMMLALLHLDEERKPLTLQQRIKRGRTIRRIQSKLKSRRKVLGQRLADPKHLMTRSRHAAVLALRKRLAGEMGVEYNSLAPSQKMQVDAKVLKQAKRIGMLAKRLLPAVRRRDIEKHQKKSGTKIQNPME